jgi:hypothetical protein
MKHSSDYESYETVFLRIMVSSSLYSKPTDNQWDGEY